MDVNYSLAAWRRKMQNILFGALALVGWLSMLGLYRDAIVYGDRLLSVIGNTLLMFLLTVMAFWHNAPFKLKSAILLIIMYLAMLFSLINGGLAGSGRSFAVGAPLIAAVIAGTRPGIIMGGVNLATLYIFTLLAPVIIPRTLVQMELTTVSTWLAESIYTTIPLVGGLTLAVGINHFLLQLLNNLQGEHSLLEEKIEQRTKQLSQALEDVEFSSRSKSLFLANMSHELRTPLNGILGYSHILQRNHSLVKDEQARQGLRIIQESGEYLLCLINDLLDLAKIESGKLEIETVPVELPGFLDGIVEIINARARQKEITFTFRSDALPFFVEADERRLRQVLINLLGNAVKFTNANGMVCLLVTLLSQTRLHVVLRFEVQDTGIGISPEKMSKLFLPFEQLSDEQQYRDSGTGLGLALSQQLVSLMGSQIQAESIIGQGSRFWFDVQLVLTNRHTLSVQLEPIGYHGPLRRCLVVDRDSSNRQVLIGILRTLKFATYEAGDVTQAIAITQLEKPELIFMDVVMPAKGGCEIIMEIRKTILDVPIIVVSASVMPTDKANSLAAGASDFLPKPVRIQELIDVIERNLSVSWLYQQDEVILQDEEPLSQIIITRSQADMISEALSVGDFQKIVQIGQEWAESTDQGLSVLGQYLVQLSRNYDEFRIEELLKRARDD